MMRYLPTLNRLREDERGTAAVELGLTISIVFTLLLGLVDLSRGYSIKLQLEQVAQRSIEKVMNGQADRGSIVNESLKTEAATAAGVAAANVTTTAWLECTTTAGVQTFYYYPNDDDQMCPAGTTGRRYLQVTVQKSFSPMFPALTFWQGLAADGTRTVRGATSVRVQ